MPPGFKWTYSEDGMFLWISAPEGVDTNELMEKAIARKVLFVPGLDFRKREVVVGGTHRNTTMTVRAKRSRPTFGRG